MILAGYAYLSIRRSPEIGTLGILPRQVGLLLDDGMVYRNFWGFGLLGLYAGLALGVSLPAGPRWSAWLITVGFLLLAPAKELAQLAFPPRDGNLWGAFLGTGGTALGILTGNIVHRIFHLRKKNTTDTKGTKGEE